MGYYRVTGGGTIGGEYTVRGSKNAVLPILAASVLSGDEVVLENVPHLRMCLFLWRFWRNWAARPNWKEEH